MPLRGVPDALREFKRGDLHSGRGGPRVTSRKQAIAIGMSSKRRMERGSKRRASRSR